jgi:hypothetical protein
VGRCLRNLEPFFPEDNALGERAQLGMARGEPRPGVHGGQDDLTDALVAPRLLRKRHGLPETVECPTIVALGLVGYAEGAVRPRPQDGIAAGRGKRQGALAGSDGLVMRAHGVEME